MVSSPSLNLSFGFTFNDLYSLEGLDQINQAFIDYMDQRKDNSLITESEWLLHHAPILEEFIAKLFSIETEVEHLSNLQLPWRLKAWVKKNFIERLALVRYPSTDTIPVDYEASLKAISELFGTNHWNETDLCQSVKAWMQDEEEDKLDIAARYVAWMCYRSKTLDHPSPLFKIHGRFDPSKPFIPEQDDSGTYVLEAHTRDGFNLLDEGITLEESLDEVHYCLYCHVREKDSCSRGLRDNKTHEVKVNPLGVTLHGCPLEQKISEMNLLKSKGYVIAALAVAMVDNPLIAATGHRICNDCMKACIFQKQVPVDIPGIETQILKEVLSLPWGVEIYSLLTRWNPLARKAPLPLKCNEARVLVVGAGPAGFTLSHYLLNLGHEVLLIDGLKIEEMPTSLTGKTLLNNSDIFDPVYDFKSLCMPLEEKPLDGFGGVCSYGITARWDKNFLTLIRLILERRQHFYQVGGVRFGATLTVDQAFALGFDHVALCMGAGKPELLSIPGGYAKGVHHASDFLMALHMAGAYQKDTSHPFPLRLPIVVIGGGLTAMDTATEALAYYPRFLEQIDGQEKEEIWKLHRDLLKVDSKDIVPLVQSWGGVTILYRQSLEKSNAYALNDNEVKKALEQGVRFKDNFIPEEFIVDELGHVCGVKDANTGEIVEARTVFIATGTKPNTTLAQEEMNAIECEGEFFKLDKDFFVRHPYYPLKMTAFGDLHPSYRGSVVKAMASAKKGAQIIHEALKDAPQSKERLPLKTIVQDLTPVVQSVKELSKDLVEIVVKAPFLAKNARPGQFFRMQRYKRFLNQAVKPFALTGLSYNQGNGTVVLGVSKKSKIAHLNASLSIGEPLVLMGPNGNTINLPFNQKILMIVYKDAAFTFYPLLQSLKHNQNEVTLIEINQDLKNTKEDIGNSNQQMRSLCDDYVILKNFEEIKRYVFNQSYEFGYCLVPKKDYEALELLPCFKSLDQVFVRLHVPMQCMMQGVCGRCIQPIHDFTGEKKFIYACKEPDQPLSKLMYSCERVYKNK